MQQTYTNLPKQSGQVNGQAVQATLIALYSRVAVKQIGMGSFKAVPSIIHPISANQDLSKIMSDKKIYLIIDDDPDDRELFCEAIQSIDDIAECNSATNGVDALQKLQAAMQLPDYIFMDINMPCMNGWQCLEWLKKEEKFKHIPVAIMSTSSYKTDQDKASLLKASCFIVKPTEFNVLIDKIAAILQLDASYKLHLT